MPTAKLPIIRRWRLTSRTSNVRSLRPAMTLTAAMHGCESSTCSSGFGPFWSASARPSNGCRLGRNPRCSPPGSTRRPASSRPCAPPAPAITSVFVTLRSCAINAAGSNSPSRRRWPHSAPTGLSTVFAAVTAGSRSPMRPRLFRQGLAERESEWRTARARRRGRCRARTRWRSSRDAFKVPGLAPDVAPAPAAEDEARLLGELRRNLAEQRGLTTRRRAAEGPGHSGSTPLEPTTHGSLAILAIAVVGLAVAAALASDRPLVRVVCASLAAAAVCTLLAVAVASRRRLSSPLADARDLDEASDRVGAKVAELASRARPSRDADRLRRRDRGREDRSRPSSGTHPRGRPAPASRRPREAQSGLRVVRQSPGAARVRTGQVRRLEAGARARRPALT